MTSQDVLDALQQEFIKIVDEIASDSVAIADAKFFDEVAVKQSTLLKAVGYCYLLMD